jgi:hypothetical protein
VARQRYAGVMIRPSGDGRRLTAHLEPGGPCIAVAERQPDGRWLVNGRVMSREHAGIALEAAVTVAAASRHRHGTAQMPAGAAVTEASSASGATAAEIIQQLTAPGMPAPWEHAAWLFPRAAEPSTGA